MRTKPSPGKREVVKWPESSGVNILGITLISVFFFREIFLHPGDMLWGNDIVRAHSAFRIIQWRSFFEHSAFPLWDPSTFCGRSITGDPLHCLFHPLSFVFWLSDSPSIFGFFLFLHFLFGAIGAFFYARRIGCTDAASCLVAVMFAFSGKLGAHLFAGHVEVLCTLLWLPWILWAAERLVESRSWKDALLLGVLLTLAATMGSVQMMYYHILFMSGYVLLRMVRKFKQLSKQQFALTCGIYIMALASFSLFSAGWWLPIVRQTLLLSARGESADYAFSTMSSVAPADLLRIFWPTLGIPDPKPLMNDAQAGFFWETSLYVGVLGIALALAACLALWRVPPVLELAVLCLLTVLTSLGSSGPLYWFVYQVVPGFALFRAPGRLLFYSTFCLAVIAGIMVSKAEQRWQRGVAAGVICAFGEFAFLAPSMLGIRDMSMSAFWLPIAFCMVAGTGAFFWTFGSISTVSWTSLCLLVVTVDLAVNWQTRAQTIAISRALPDPPVAIFLGDARKKEEFRILDTSGAIEQQIAARHGLEIISGYHPGVYGHYLEFYNAIWYRDESDIVEMIVHRPEQIYCWNILDLMNVKYVVTSTEFKKEGLTEVFKAEPAAGHRRAYVYKRETTMPRAFVVAEAVTPPPGMIPLDILCTLNPREQCIVEQNPIEGTASFQELELRFNSFGSMSASFRTEAPGVLVASQTWHPDWRIMRNGEILPLLKVNHAQIGAALPAGDHEIQIYYWPWDFYLGLAVSAGSLIAAGSGALVARYRLPKVQGHD